MALRNIAGFTEADGVGREAVKLAAVFCRPGGRVGGSAWGFRRGGGFQGGDETLRWYGRVHTTRKRVPDDSSNELI